MFDFSSMFVEARSVYLLCANLAQVYINILASLPTLPAGLRSSINRNLTDIVELHDEILGELHRVVPYSEYTQVDFPSKALSSNFHGHRRWRSLGTVPEDKNSSMTWLRDVPGMTTDPRVAAEVARIFSSKVGASHPFKMGHAGSVAG